MTTLETVRERPLLVSEDEVVVLRDLWRGSNCNGHSFGCVNALPSIKKLSTRRILINLLRAKRIIDVYAEENVVLGEGDTRFSWTERGKSLFTDFDNSPDVKEQFVKRKSVLLGSFVSVEADGKTETNFVPAPVGASASPTKPGKSKVTKGKKGKVTTPEQKSTTAANDKPKQETNGSTTSSTPPKKRGRPAKDKPEKLTSEVVGNRILKALSSRGELTREKLIPIIGTDIGIRSVCVQLQESGMIYNRNGVYSVTAKGKAHVKELTKVVVKPEPPVEEQKTESDGTDKDKESEG